MTAIIILIHCNWISVIGLLYHLWDIQRCGVSSNSPNSLNVTGTFHYFWRFFLFKRGKKGRQKQTFCQLSVTSEIPPDLCRCRYLRGISMQIALSVFTNWVDIIWQPQKIWIPSMTPVTSHVVVKIPRRKALWLCKNKFKEAKGHILQREREKSLFQFMKQTRDNKTLKP